jgi:carbon storage regulator
VWQAVASGAGPNSLKEGAIMLVLSRRVGESVVIEGGIVVTVTAVQGDRVRLGISAPPTVRVDRAEIHERRSEFSPPTPLPTSARRPRVAALAVR